MDESTCAICLSSYTASTRRRVTCQYCPDGACRPCQQQYLLNTYEDPHCFKCKRGWSAEFLCQNFPKSFVHDTLRKHRRKVLLEREKGMLPAMQTYAEAWRKKRDVAPRVHDLYNAYQEASKNTAEIQTSYRQALDVYHDVKTRHLQAKQLGGATEELRTMRRKAREAYDVIKAEYDRRRSKRDMAYVEYNTADTELTRWRNIYEGRVAAAGAEATKRQFLMRCPAEGCRGFLSTAYKCGICDKHTCSECLELLGLATGTVEELKAAHTCKPDNVESAKAIKKETRPCPKCGARIFKIDGCDQMFCTVEGCGTAFSWNTGQVVSGRIHNPHYYEWLRRNGGGTAPREAGDIPCGGLPAAWEFTRATLRQHGLSTDDKNTLLEIHRCLSDFTDRLPEYPSQKPAMLNKEVDVAYLNNIVDEAEWQRQLEFNEAKFNRKREIGMILQTLVTAGADVLRTVLLAMEGDPAATQFIQTTALPQLEQLRIFTNDSYRELSSRMRMAVPQINAKWKFSGLRALYKPAKAAAASTAHSEAAPSAADDGPPPLAEDDDVAAPDLNVVA